jgi:thiol:disulfide interchange protein DsbD
MDTINTRRRHAVIGAAALIGTSMLGPVQAADKFLDPKVAFRFSSRRLDANTVELRWTIAPGYYMYRERFKITAEGAPLAAPILPAGEKKFDENFGQELEIYKHEVVVPIALAATAAGTTVIKAVGQGCAEGGLCYPPQDWSVRADAIKG